jgi:hypothetical protein
MCTDLSGDRSHLSVIPVYIGYCAVFKDREEARTPNQAAHRLRGVSCRRSAGLSKLNSMQASAD